MPFRSFVRSWRATEKYSNEKHSSQLSKPVSKWREVQPQASTDTPEFATPRTFSRQTSANMNPASPLNDRYASHDETSSTDAGESDVSPVALDFGDFPSSDGETSDAAESVSPISDIATAASVYSVQSLLRLRSPASDEKYTVASGSALVRYSAQNITELPSPAGALQSKPATPDRTMSQAPETRSWPADSWRQALPESTADSWIAQQRKRESANSSEDDTSSSIFRTARSILNKLTVEKFDSLFDQLTQCGFKHPQHVSMLMQEVFEKATIQHHFIPMYAELCMKLEKDPQIASVVEQAGELYNFRRLLLNQCQNVFEQLLESGSADAVADEEAAFRRKQRALGNMKLIGHLLTNAMLSSELFPACCEELVSKRAACPEALESLVALMMVAGPKFDTNDWQYKARLDKVLLDMRKLIKDKSVPPRSRFLIRDVLDARDAGWPHSPKDGCAAITGPAKLDEVRNQADAPLVQPDFTSTEQAKTKPQADSAQAPLPTAGARNKSKTSVSSPEPAKEAFDLVAFRRNLNTVFSDLASDKNIPAAVQRVRELQAPADVQAAQFVDMLTRVVEERRGAVRRTELAFLAGLGAAENSAFDRKECIAGVGLFFSGVYDELCKEVHRLPPIMKSEFMPTMLSVFPADELNKVVPCEMRK